MIKPKILLEEIAIARDISHSELLWGFYLFTYLLCKQY